MNHLWIATQITMALMEKGVKLCYVTHLYEFAHRLYEKKLPNVVFSRAERRRTPPAHSSSSNEVRTRRVLQKTPTTKSSVRSQLRARSHEDRRDVMMQETVSLLETRWLVSLMASRRS